MKKIICTALAIIMCFPFLVGCDEGEIQVPVSKIPDLTSVISQFDDIDIEYFTCRISKNNSNRQYTVDVDSEFQNVLGEQVVIEIPDYYVHNIRENDKLRVVIDDVDISSDLIKIKASYIQRISGKVYNSVYSTIRNPLPDFEDLKIRFDFPGLDDSDGYWEEIKKSGSDIAARVVSITDDAVYFTSAYGVVSFYAIDGVPNCSFSIGDCVNIKYSKYYQQGIDSEMVYKIDVNDITSFELSSVSDIDRAYSLEHQDYDTEYDKPVIYLYPQEDTKCSVKVNLDGKLTCTYPEHGENGWQNFIAKPDGTLVFPDGSEYYCLYWEGEASMNPDFTKGFCVKGEDTAKFLADILPKTGLNPREANEFIIYWLPILQKNEYNLISFQTEAYTSTAELIINPAPDSLLRVYMVAKPLDTAVEIEPQTFEGFERKGFTVVEWGGSIISD